MQSEVGQQQEEVQQPEVDMHSEVVELVGQHQEVGQQPEVDMHSEVVELVGQYQEVVQIQLLIRQPKANV